MRSELPRVLEVSQASAYGITRSRLRTELGHGQWRRLVRGIVLTRPDRPTRTDWAAAGLALGGKRAVLSGWDATRYYGLGDPKPPQSAVLVLVDVGRSRSLGGAHIRRTHGPLASRLVSINDPQLPLARLAEPARAVVDAAMAYSSLTPVRALVPSAIQRGRCDPEELCAQVPQVARRGSLLLRKALVDVLDNAHSAAEATALSSLRYADVPPFELNVLLLDEEGRLVGVADFLWRELRAVLEIDSRQFHFSENDWLRTSDRHNRLTSRGLALTHYSPARISSGDLWLTEVASWLRGRARELGIGYRADPRVLRDGPPLYLPDR